MGINREELSRIKEYLKSESYDVNDWCFMEKTIVADKILIKDDASEVFSFIHINERGKNISVFISVSVRHLNSIEKLDKLNLNLEVYSLEQLKKAESKAEELLEMANKWNLWK